MLQSCTANRAALLTPPDEQKTLTVMPEGYEPEEIDRWMRGVLVLTEEGLFNYWQQEWVICNDRLHYLETTLGTVKPPTTGEVRAQKPEIVTWTAEQLQTFLTWNRDEREDELFPLWFLVLHELPLSEAIALAQPATHRPPVTDNPEATEPYPQSLYDTGLDANEGHWSRTG